MVFLMFYFMLLPLQTATNKYTNDTIFYVKIM